MASPHLIAFSELDERPLLPCNRLMKLKMIFNITEGGLFERVILVETRGHSDERCGRPGFMTLVKLHTVVSSILNRTLVCIPFPVGVQDRGECWSG